MITFKLPTVASGSDTIDKYCGKSIPVLGKVVGFKYLHICFYYHIEGVWGCESVHGEVEVSEWWPIPEEGSGHVVEMCGVGYE